jgi:hypothetical protein
VTLVRESAAQGHIGQRQCGSREELKSFFEAAEARKLSRRTAQVATKASRQMYRMYADGPCDRGDGEIFRVAILEQFKGIPQPWRRRSSLAPWL